MIIKSLPVGMLHTNCYIIGDEEAGECTVFDPGAHSDKVLAAIAETGLKCTRIVLTHGHFDHVMGAPKVQRETKAKLYIHHLDEFWLEPELAQHPGYLREEYVKPRVDGYLEEGMEFSIGSIFCKVLNTKGHSKGSCVILVGDSIMIAGDTLFLGSCGRWDLEGGDPDEMLDSLWRLAELPGNWRVFSGHGEPTTLDHEREFNPIMGQALSR